MTTVTALSHSPRYITTDGTDLYVSLNNHTIAKVTLTGVVTTIAGSGSTGNSDGNGTSATFNEPKGLVYLNNKLYVAQYYGSRIRVIDLATNEVTTHHEGGAYDITTDGTYLYIANYGQNKIRKVLLSDSSQTSDIGTGTQGYVDGDASTAQFKQPSGIHYYNGNVYIYERNQYVRKYNVSTGIVSTYAGSGGSEGQAPVDGDLLSAKIAMANCGLTISDNGLVSIFGGEAVSGDSVRQFSLGSPSPLISVNVQNLTIQYVKSATANKNILGKDTDVAVDDFSFTGKNRIQTRN